MFLKAAVSFPWSAAALGIFLRARKSLARRSVSSFLSCSSVSAQEAVSLSSQYERAFRITSIYSNVLSPAVDCPPL